jgi:uncharacterized iron-regulated protein
MKHILFIISCLFATHSLTGQTKAYVIYNSKGKKVSYEKTLEYVEKKDIVLFGEFHNNPISHWLQYELTEDLEKKRNLILGAEMFEADNQDALNLYLNDSINQEELDTLARLWPNYKTDYAPLVNFAKDSVIPFIATNIPRRFASMVYKKGFSALDSLNEEEKEWVATLPILYDSTLSRYVNILQMMGKHGSPKLIKAQASKDATMAHFIYKNYVPGSLFLHYNGAYHSDYHEGILWYLKNLNPKLKYSTITTVSQKDVNKLLEENKGIADYIICVDENMTKTH